MSNMSKMSSTSTLSSAPSNPFLRNALLLDAAATGATGLLLIGGAGLLEGLLGLPAGLMRWAGLLLVPFVAFVAWAGTREPAPQGAVALIIAVNVLWVVASVCLLLSGLVSPTLLGILFVLAQAATVALFAELQFVGLKRAHAMAA